MVALAGFPPLTHTQCLSTKTFHPPPLDGSLTLPELYDWQLKHSPSHPLFRFLEEDGSTRIVYWAEAVRAVYTAARMVRDRLKGVAPGSVVAILAPSDAIPYFIALVGIMRADFVPFPISPRNSAAAVAHLVEKSQVNHILVGREQSMANLAKDALEVLERTSPAAVKPEFSPMPLFEELFLPESQSSVDASDLPYVSRGLDALAFILHSSGSTAFPKPIYWTHTATLAAGVATWVGGRDLCGQVFSLHVMPMYHGMGAYQCFSAATTGVTYSAFKPSIPVPLPSPDSVYHAAKATDSDLIFCVPSFVEAWSKNPEYVKWLATRAGVLFGGGPLNKEAGDYMYSQGVTIFNMYGCTEAGIMTAILPATVDKDWEYFEFTSQVTPHMVPHEDNTFELVMLSNDWKQLNVTNTVVDGIPAYATSDLLKPHPTKPGFWKIHGRCDDQIMHSTGEKTNPGPLENILSQDPHVQSSIMFGRGRFQAGLLVDPRPQFKFDPADTAKLAEFRNLIWPTVERANAYAPQHSRLFKEMILVAKPSKPFTYTAKSTPRRQAIINEYEDEIDIAYDLLEESVQPSIPPPTAWDPVNSREFVRIVVTKVLGHTLRDDQDVFQHGCDSLQATYIRNTLLRAIRETTKVDTRNVSSNFVYDNPTITELSEHVWAITVGAGSGQTGSQAARAAAMRAMAEKYSQGLASITAASNTAQNPANRSSNRDSTASTAVFVTGTTGGLGCHLLAHLVGDPTVDKIYAFNRPDRGGISLHERQKAALLDRGLAHAISQLDKVDLIEGDLTEDHFGLASNDFDALHNSVTHIIHNAWRVDFNLALSSFEPNVKGLRALVDFALSSPLPGLPHFAYTSSIGVIQNFDASKIVEEAPINPEVATGTGYVESKWISEKILLEVAAQTPLKPSIVRVGQITGASGGDWNVNEWFPSMVQASARLGCFPMVDGLVDWIPLDQAASALLEICDGSDCASVVHLVHPRPVVWATIAKDISSELQIKTVSYSEWISELESLSQKANDTRGKDDTDVLKGVRAVRLLPFFRSIVDKQHTEGAMGFPVFDVKRAKAFSPTLADPDLRQIGGEDVQRWMAYWRRVGMFDKA